MLSTILNLPEVVDVLKTLDSNNEDYYPDEALIFKSLDVDNPVVVILGQDPYPTKGYAIGLAFACPDYTKTPASLKNMIPKMQEATDNASTSSTSSNDLSHLTQQNVILLNTALTIKVKNNKGISTSHTKLWKKAIQKIIQHISDTYHPVWLLMGNHALKFKKYIGDDNFVCSSHPSPLSFKNKLGEYPSFQETNVFKSINDILINKEMDPIIWW